MDPLTHSLLGASVGQAFYSHKLGRKSLVFGALAAILPDIDSLGGAFYGSLAGLVIHRGPTHSLWFPFVIGPLLGYFIWKWYSRKNALNFERPLHWIGLVSLALLSHPLLDVCTSYGTQLFAPFSNHRFSIDAIAIIDPLYTLILLASVGAGIWACNKHQQRIPLARSLACLALAFSTAYIFYGRILNEKAEKLALSLLNPASTSSWQVHAYPTLLQLYYRRLVAQSSDNVCVGHVSLWQDSKISWQCQKPADGPKINLVRATPEGKIFDWFAMGMTFATIQQQGNYSLVQISDLRYGFEKPHESLWMIQAKVSPDNHLLSPVTYQEARFTKSALWEYLKQIWLRTFYATRNASTPNHRIK